NETLLLMGQRADKNVPNMPEANEPQGCFSESIQLPFFSSRRRQSQYDCKPASGSGRPAAHQNILFHSQRME
ncbi:hypothetical protein ABTD90_21865, partial [Acinetobacter baumannii]